MAVAFRSKSGVTSGGPTSTSITVTAPASIAQNDILILSLLISGANASAAGPTGWTLAYTKDNSTNLYSSRVWWIRRGASNPSFVITWTGSESYWEYSCVAYSGCITSGNPYNDLQTATATSVNPANPNPPSVTTTVPNTVNVVIGIGSQGCTTSWATPSGYTARDSGIAGGSLSVFDKALASATTEDCAVITGSAAGINGWDAVAIALQPPASAGLLAIGGAGSSGGGIGTSAMGNAG